MTAFSVWAPRAGEVAVEVGGAHHPMGPDGDRGWYGAEVPGAGPGDEYRFVIDGDALPDPRSPWQPAGVGGPSRLVDHGAFAWGDQGWAGFDLAGAVLYELHVGTFSPEGTFEGVARRLDHLVDLGVDAVELLPVNQFPGRWGWGYDGVGLFAPHQPYGGPDGLKALVDACHRRGLGVVLDVVYNHLGPAGNHLARFGPYFTARYHTPWGDAVNLDGPGSDEVRSFFCDNALMWLRDYHVDALRLDAVHGFVDTSATHLLEQLAQAVDSLAAHLGRPLHLIAESDLNDPRVVRTRAAGGLGMRAQWSDDFHHALHAVLTGERSGYYGDFGSVADVATALRQGFVYAGRYSAYRGRTHGRADPSLRGDQLLGYLQDHDQVGNRARGERISALASLDRVKVGAALVLTSPFVPMLFAGEEWAASTPFPYFCDHDDPGLAEAVRAGRRAEFAGFGWDPEAIPDPQAPATFESARLDWDEPARPPHADVLAWYRRLLALRRQQPGLRAGPLGEVATRHDDQARWLVVERGPVAVAANLGWAPARLDVRGRLLAASQAGVAAEPGGPLTLPPDSVAVVDRTGAG